MRKIQSSEYTMPVWTIALAAIQVVAHHSQLAGIDAGVFRIINDFIDDFLFKDFSLGFLGGPEHFPENR